MTWTDSTSYSRGDKEKKQNAWSLQTAMFRITVTTGHMYYPGKWIMHCLALGLDTVPLVIPSTASPEQAQAIALQKVKERLDLYNDAFNSIV